MNNKEKCEVIEKILQSDKINYDEKILYIRGFLLHYYEFNQISWIWDN